MIKLNHTIRSRVDPREDSTYPAEVVETMLSLIMFLKEKGRCGQSSAFRWQTRWMRSTSL